MAYDDNDADMLGKTGSTGSSSTGTDAETMSGNADRDYATTETTHSAQSTGGTSDWATNQGQSQTGQAMDQAKDKAGQVMDQAQQKSAQVMDQAQQQAKSMFENQKGQAADRLGSVANALRQTGQHLRDDNETAFGQYADRAANSVQHFSDRLRDQNVDQLIGEAQDFARREPQLFLGGAVIAGILLARFLKSSSPSQPSSQRYYRGGAPMHPQRSTHDYGSTWTGESYYPQATTPTLPPGDVE